MRRHPSWDAPRPHLAQVSGDDDPQEPAPVARRPRAQTADSQSLSLRFFTDPPTPRTRVLRSTSDDSLMASSLSLSCVLQPNQPSDAASGISTSGAHSDDPSGQTVAAPKKKRIRIKTERRREQCRVNQARYRNKQKKSAMQLKDTVEELRDQIEQLQQRHDTLHRAPTTPRRTNPRDLVLDLFGVFRFGLNVGHDESSFSLVPARQLPSLESQVAFVTSTFEPDARVGDAHGHTVFLEQARRFATLFSAVETTPLRVEQPAPDGQSVRVTFRLDLTVSPRTLRHVFPHLVRAEHHQIRWKLLGQQLRCAGSSVLLFNDHGRVSHVNWSLDWVAALQTVLTIEETAVVLQHAQIEQDAYISVPGEDSRTHAGDGRSPRGRHASAMDPPDPAGWNEQAASDLLVEGGGRFAVV